MKQVPSLSVNQKVMSYKQEIYVVLAQGDQCDCDTGQAIKNDYLDVYVATVSGSLGMFAGGRQQRANSVVTVGSLALSLEPPPKLV